MVIRMVSEQIVSYEAFWIYLFTFVISTMLTIIIGYILASRSPSKIKAETFECGQEEDIHPHETFIRGADRYFAYAVAFFILDAFVWILIAGAASLKMYIPTGLFISLYIVSLFSVLAYYIFKVREAL